MNKFQSVAFTGHRNITGITEAELSKRLNWAIISAYKGGYRYFLSGMAAGFDMLAAEAVLDLKKRYPDMYLAAIVPFPGQADSFRVADKERYRRILDAADNIVVLFEHYFRGCFLRRDDYLVDNSKRVIACLDDRGTGGTYYTVNRAFDQKLSVVNLLKIQEII